jgi:proteasome regulatory subunit
MEFSSKIKNLDSMQYYENLNVLKNQVNALRLQNQALINEKNKILDDFEKMKKSAGIIAIAQEIFGDKLVARGYNGVVFYVNIPKQFEGKIKNEDRVALAQHTLNIIDVLPQDKDYRSLAFETITKPDTNFKDIGGLENIIKEIEETVFLPLSRPELFEKYGIESPKGILLHGPPGTGKTMLAKAVANKSKATFIGLNGSELIHKFIGEGAKVVKDLFLMAREKAPSIVFIDEIDSVAAYRLDSSSGADREVHRTLMQLLVEMDGFTNRDNVRIIGATNRIDILDKAILRSGRFDRIIEVGLPDQKARKKIFKIYTKKMPLDKEVTSEKLSKLTNGISGADIEAICREAAIFSMRDGSKNIKIKEFKKAIEKVKGIKEEATKEYGEMFR